MNPTDLDPRACALFLLTAFLLAGGCWIVASEGLANRAALAWGGIAILLALPWTAAWGGVAKGWRPATSGAAAR